MHPLTKFGWSLASGTFLTIFIVRLLAYFSIGVPVILMDIGTVASVLWALSAVMVAGAHTKHFVVLVAVFVAVLVIGLLIISPLYGLHPFALSPGIIRMVA